MPAQVIQLADHREIFSPGQVLVDRHVLSRQADQRLDAIGFLDDVEAGDRGLTGIRPEQGRQDSDGRGLSGAIWPQQCNQAAATDVEVEPVERAGLAEVLGQPFGVDRPVGHPTKVSG